MTQTRLPWSNCLDCGKAMDAASAMTHDNPPKKGDVSICLYCGHIMIFRGNLTLRALTDEEMLEIAGNPQLIQMQKARATVVMLETMNIARKMGDIKS
jgi:hypothetical protein